MAQAISSIGKTIQFEYDDVMDMLFISYAPPSAFAYYGEIEEMPGAMLAYNRNDEFIGFAFEGVEYRLGDTSPEALKRLAITLVERFTPFNAI